MMWLFCSHTTISSIYLNSWWLIKDEEEEEEEVEEEDERMKCF